MGALPGLAVVKENLTRGPSGKPVTGVTVTALSSFTRERALILPRAALFILISLWLALPARASIELRASELKQVDNVYELDAEFDVTLNRTLEDALNRGVTLSFVVEFEVDRPRTLIWDEAVAAVSLPLKLRYNPLTRQYQLSAALRTRNFPTLDEARSELGRISAWPVLDAPLLKKRYSYEAALRMRLDLSQLPKSLQASALFSRDWSLDSGWHTWELRP